MSPKQPAMFYVRQQFHDAVVKVTDNYRNAGNAEREALIHTEKQARLGYVGLIVEVINTENESTTWKASIPARYQIKLEVSK